MWFRDGVHARPHASHGHHLRDAGRCWFHIKLTLVVLGILSVHGIVRGRVAKFSRGQTPTVPSWLWSVLLVAIVGIIVMVVRGPIMFAPK